MEEFTDFDNKEKLIWYEPSLTYDFHEENKREENVTFKLTEAMQNNATIYAHIYINKEDAPIDPTYPNYVKEDVIYKRRRIIFIILLISSIFLLFFFFSIYFLNY